jgi:hypothetical protein
MGIMGLMGLRNPGTYYTSLRSGPCGIHKPASVHTPKFIHHPTLKAYKMPNEADIQAGLNELDESDVPNIKTTAEKYNLVPLTLNQCFHKKTISSEEIKSNYF